MLWKASISGLCTPYSRQATSCIIALGLVPCTEPLSVCVEAVASTLQCLTQQAFVAQGIAAGKVAGLPASAGGEQAAGGAGSFCGGCHRRGHDLCCTPNQHGASLHGPAARAGTRWWAPLAACILHRLLLTGLTDVAAHPWLQMT